MATRGSFDTLAGVSPEQRLIEQIASSSAFAKAPAIRKLLLYLWERRDQEISEYAIAFDALNKPEQFDPKLDASVRVHISRLRQKLREYFEHEGTDATCRVVIPQGAPGLRLAPVSRQPQGIDRRDVFRRYGLPALALGLACLCVFLWFRYDSTRDELARARSNLQLPAVWRTILKPGRLTRVVYPIPVFYRWGTLRIRDVRINRPDDLQQSEELKAMSERLGPPSVSRSYTVSADTMAAIQLTRFLSMHGTPLEVTPTENISVDQYGSDNLIFLGITPTNALLGAYVSRLNFHVMEGSGRVANRTPRPNEPAVYHPQTRSKDASATESYGVVAALPGHAAGTGLVLVVGAQTSAIGSFITSPHGIEEITRHWHQAGEPLHFEMVIRTVSDGFHTHNASVVAFREFAK